MKKSLIYEQNKKHLNILLNKLLSISVILLEKNLLSKTQPKHKSTWLSVILNCFRDMSVFIKQITVVWKN